MQKGGVRCGWDKVEDLCCELGYGPWNNAMDDMCEQVVTRAPGILISTISMGIPERHDTRLRN